MPEIWLRYGTTDVVLDIRFENLAGQVSSNFPSLPDEQVKDALAAVPATDNMLVVAMSSSRAVARAVSEIAARAPTAVTVDVPGRLAGSLRSGLAALNPQAPVSINRIDYQQSLDERMKNFKSTAVISQAAYDPLFGFAGAPTALVRALYPEKMSEAFGARRGNVPEPGVQGAPLKVATAATESLSNQATATAVELVANGAGIAGVHVGTVNGAFADAVSQLKSMPPPAAAEAGEQARSAIISASSEPGPHATLAGALNSLWNCAHVVKEGGTAVLLAECREGVGGGALQALVEGRLKQEQVALSPYVEGLEHLLYIQELRQKRELGLVSSLPNYYASKLGFSTYAGVKDAFEKMLAKHGKGHKSLVLSDADIISPVKTAG
jgi:hypothetical protein